MNTVDKLADEMQSLIKNYSKMPISLWTEKTKILAGRVLAIFNTEPVDYSDNMISLIARSIVFWDETTQIKAVETLWNKITASEMELQDRLASIVFVVMNGIEVDKIKGSLPGIEKLDTKKSYGSNMAALLRKYGR
jgi:hypothetical protein